MDLVETIKVGDLVTYEDWASAERGALLQMAIDGAATIGIRVSREGGLPGFGRGAFMVLVGESAGRMYADEELSGPAVDVTAQVEIVALRPAPLVRSKGMTIEGGMLLGFAGQKPVYFVATAAGDGGVCVRSDREDMAVGQFISSVSNLLVISVKVDVQPRPTLAPLDPVNKARP